MKYIIIISDEQLNHTTRSRTNISAYTNSQAILCVIVNPYGNAKSTRISNRSCYITSACYEQRPISPHISCHVSGTIHISHSGSYIVRAGAPLFIKPTDTSTIPAFIRSTCEVFVYIQFVGHQIIHEIIIPHTFAIDTLIFKSTSTFPSYS